MCCLFTCFGWIIDLVQRLWTFTMACCISSAVCCALVTASMSGIALGYNYSLAEYIDLKETNVSVFLKRGVFDDEIADDMDWRRAAGHLPVAGHLNEDNLVTGASVDDDNYRRSGKSSKSGRRMDDSIIQTDDQNSFEGSLMKLTSKPLFDTGTTTKGYGPGDEDMHNAVANSDTGTIDQLKAVQGLINRRKYNFATLSTRPGEAILTPPLDTKQLTNFAYPEKDRGREGGMGARRGMEIPVPKSDSLRNAVPAGPYSRYMWINPKLPPEKRYTLDIDDDYPTYPPPVTPRVGPLRPSRPKPSRWPTLSRARPVVTTSTESYQKSVDEELREFRDGLFKDKFGAQERANSAEFMKSVQNMPPVKPGAAEDYEEEIKGLPVRKRRNVKVFLKSGSTSEQNNYTKTDSKIVHTEPKVKEDVSESFFKDLSKILNNVKDRLITTVICKPDSMIQPTVHLEISTQKHFLTMMKTTIS